MARKAFTGQLKHTCSVHTPQWSATPDAHGQPQQGTPTVVQNVPCLYMVRSHMSRPGFEAISPIKDILSVDHIIFMEPRTVDSSCWITNIKRGSTVIAAGPLNIVLVKDAAGQNHHLEIHVTEGQAAGV